MRIVVDAMARVGLATTCFLALAGAAQAAPRDVSLESGTIAGIAAPDAAVDAYLGIPFAAPPIGDRRWRAPEPVQAWQGVRKADHFGASCIQPEPKASGPWTREFYAKPPFTEDCLFLNVWTPARAAGDKLPVVVWLHGGGFTQGGADEAIYYGGKLAERGIVFVSINYRVGLMGFFAHPELTREGANGSAGNYGLLDQIAALRWVQRNIAAFGGDPAHVTLQGQSAGASSVGALLASPLAKGLFQAAIAESGLTLADPSPFVPLAKLTENGTLYARQKGAAGVAALRALPPEQLIQPREASIQFGPAVDGAVLTQTPTEALNAGATDDIPVLTGWNAAEGAAPFDTRTTPAEHAAKLQALYGTRAAEAERLYLAAPGDASAAAQQSAHDRLMVGAYLWSAAKTANGRSPVYLYQFDHVLPGPTAPRWGAFHSSEIPYAFGTLDALDRPFTAADRAVSDKMLAYWANFIRSGSPNGPGLPVWPAFAAESAEIMHLGDAPGVQPVAGKERFDFLSHAIGAPR